MDHLELLIFLVGHLIYKEEKNYKKNGQKFQQTLM